MLGLSFLMLGVEEIVKPYLSISSLLGVMILAIIISLCWKEERKEIEAIENI